MVFGREPHATAPFLAAFGTVPFVSKIIAPTAEDRFKTTASGSVNAAPSVPTPAVYAINATQRIALNARPLVTSTRS